MRTGHGRVEHLMHKWGSIPTPGCDCGALNQNTDHIVRVPKEKIWKIEDIFNATPEAIDRVKSFDIIL